MDANEIEYLVDKALTKRTEDIIKMLEENIFSLSTLPVINARLIEEIKKKYLGE